MHPFDIQNLLGPPEEESRAASPASTIELSEDSRSASPSGTITLSSDDEETLDAEEVGKSFKINITSFFHDSHMVCLFAFLILFITSFYPCIFLSSYSGSFFVYCWLLTIKSMKASRPREFSIKIPPFCPFRNERH